MLFYRAQASFFFGAKFERRILSNPYDSSRIQVIPTAENIYALIRQVKQRPGFYFDADNLSALYHFINGYLQALAAKNIEEKLTPPLSDFHEFVRRRTQFGESTSGWRSMLLSYNGNDEAKALGMFFILFEAFTNATDFREKP
jgi:hypothetical protein